MSRSFPPVPAEPHPAEPHSPDQRLLDAARSDNLLEAHSALAAGADPSATDQHGRTARALAAEYGHRDLVRLLDQVTG